MTDFTSKEIASLKARAHDLPATVQVGKSGVTNAIATELKAQLKRQELVKARMLQSARDEVSSKDLAQDLAARAGAVLVEVRGNTAVFYAPRRGGGVRRG